MQKHAKICKKVFMQKRKAFDVKEQRKATDAAGKGVEGQDGGGFGMPASRRKPPARAKASEAKPAAQGKIPKWKL